MTTSLDILNCVYAALLGPEAENEPPVYATAAAGDVARPGDLPTQLDQYPRFKLRIIAENRVSLGRGTVQFQTTATIRVQGEVSAPAAIGDVAASTAEPQLWQLKHQADVAIVNSYPLFAMVQQLAAVNSQFAFTGEQRTHLAGIQTDFTFEFYEGPEDFAPVEADDVLQLHAEITNHQPVGFTTDLPQ